MRFWLIILAALVFFFTPPCIISHSILWLYWICYIARGTQTCVFFNHPWKLECNCHSGKRFLRGFPLVRVARLGEMLFITLWYFNFYLGLCFAIYEEGIKSPRALYWMEDWYNSYFSHYHFAKDSHMLSYYEFCVLDYFSGFIWSFIASTLQGFKEEDLSSNVLSS